jgi:hypothetical protein
VTRRCSKSGCYAPEISCQIGESVHSDCPHWREGAEPTQDPGAQIGANLEGFPVPWTGNALGLTDLPFITARGNPRIVSIVGTAGTGKTTILSAFYLLLARGELEMNANQFAGSYTLGGWENIAHSLRWANDGGPRFPPHTPSGAGRAPGLLHLAFRDDAAGIQDVFFADAPGEWFRSWAIQREAPEAEGARWLSANADVFLLVADCEALSGPELGTARQQFQSVAQRLAAEVRGRPTALVWTKADKEVRSEVVTTVLNTVRRHFGEIPEFSVSVYPTDERGDDVSFAPLFAWALESRTRPVDITSEAPTLSDPFVAYGRI